MFNLTKTSSPSVKNALGGVAIAMALCYLLLHLPNLLRGDFYPDLVLLRNLLLIGAIVLGYGWWEERQAA